MKDDNGDTSQTCIDQVKHLIGKLHQLISSQGLYFKKQNIYRFIKKASIASTDIVRKFLLLAPKGRFYFTSIMKKYLQILDKSSMPGIYPSSSTNVCFLS